MKNSNMHISVKNFKLSKVKKAERKEAMKDILETIIVSLVENKDAVEIKETVEERLIAYEVKVAEDDMGRIIGKQGRLAKSIRTVMKSLAGKEHKKVTVEFVG